MSNEITQINNNEVQTMQDTKIVPGFTSAGGFELMRRMASIFCKSTIAPETFRGENNFGNCVIAVEMAQRMQVSPLLLMQNMYVVYGNPAFSSKFLISTFNMCGRYTSIKYKSTGTKGTDSWGCIAYTTEKATNEIIDGPEITIKLAKDEGWYSKNNSKWRTMPEQMLRYRAAAFLIRTTAPELSMGYQTYEEVIDITPVNSGVTDEIKSNANTEVFKAKDVEVLDPVPEKQKPAKKESEKTKLAPTVVDDEEGPGF